MSKTNLFRVAFSAWAAMVLAGCQTNKSAAPASSASSAAPTTATAPARPAIRIKAGSATPVTDSTGALWQAESGFDGGDSISRPDLEIVNTKTPELYRSEHYGMNSFTYSVPNGKYIVKLHFAETFEGIEAAGQRVFSFNVQGKEFKDFDVWAKAGGPRRAYVETVPVEVTDGKVHVTFTSQVENPQVNAIEILPAS